MYSLKNNALNSFRRSVRVPTPSDTEILSFFTPTTSDTETFLLYNLPPSTIKCKIIVITKN